MAIGCAVPGAGWLLSGHLESPETLHRLDFRALWPEVTRPRSRPASRRLTASAAPLLLVCTNGRRDVCCAVFGRPLAHDAAVQRPGQVWETSHTGGHRFSPTAVLLPWGVTLARLDARLAVATLDAAADGRLPRDIARARSTTAAGPACSPPGQAAESAVRAELAETAIEALTTRHGPTATTAWSARCTIATAGPGRRSSGAARRPGLAGTLLPQGPRALHDVRRRARRGSGGLVSATGRPVALVTGGSRGIGRCDGRAPGPAGLGRRRRLPVRPDRGRRPSWSGVGPPAPARSPCRPTSARSRRRRAVRGWPPPSSAGSTRWWPTRGSSRRAPGWTP